MIDQRRETRGRKPTIYPYQGRQVTLAELAEISGRPASTIRDRLKSGKTVEEAVAQDTIEPEALVVSYRGEECTLEEWAGITGISKSKLYARLFQLGWSKEEAFGDVQRQRPDQQIITVQTPDGPVWKTLKDWSRYRGIAESTISRRLSLGWTEEQALGYEPRPRLTRRIITVQTPDGPVKKSLSEWASYTGLSKRTILTRLSRDWTNEQAMGYEPSPSELRYGGQSGRDDDVNG